MINHILLTAIISVTFTIITASAYNLIFINKLEKINTEFLESIKKITFEIINRYQ